MARISTRYLLDGGERVTPPTTTTPVTTPAVTPKMGPGPVTGAGSPAAVPTSTTKADEGYWIHDAGKDTTNPDGTVNWNEYWSTDPSRTRVTRVTPQVLSAGGTSGAGAGTDPALTALLQQLQQQNLAATLAAQAEADRRAAAAQAERQSAYDLLYQQFSQYGLGALVEPLKGFITSGINPAEFTIRLRETDAYKKRFAANQARINKGLRALSEAEYITLEDQYQNVMRQYGLPASYYTRGDMGRQEGFEKFISEDVSPVELEDRISNAQERVLQSAPEIGRMLRQFYPDISNGDILAYALDPRNALNAIKRKITAAEIGAGATQAGLATGMARAEELAQYGVSKEQARQGFSTIAEFLPTAQKLGDIYAKQGVAPFTQTTAEQEVFGLAGAAEAQKQRKKLTELEQASFSGSAGLGVLARDRAGAI